MLIESRRSLAMLSMWLALMSALPLCGSTIFRTARQPSLTLPPAAGSYMIPFSWSAFTALLLVLCVLLLPFVQRVLHTRSSIPPARQRSGEWRLLTASLLLLGLFWFLAWTRFPFMGELQFHTFTPLWLSYILAANCVLRRRKGSAPLFDDRGAYLPLFPASAILWWFFEYLNRFTENWAYQNISHFSPLTYVVFATLAYSTVLPAISITYELIADTHWLKPFREWTRLNVSNSTILLLAAASALGLFLLPVFPFELFPLLWLSPIFLLLALQQRFGIAGLADEVIGGNWAATVGYAVAGLLCGILWETWNYLSLARWIYDVPYVGAFKIFEMPLLGYAGYLPFGILCGMVIRIMAGQEAPRRRLAPASSQDYFPILL